MIWIFLLPALAFAWLPKKGIVPDKATAVKIAEAVAVPIYGEYTIKSEHPLKATLQDGEWLVEGTFNKGPEVNGGVVEVRIKKSTGEILDITHGK